MVDRGIYFHRSNHHSAVEDRLWLEGGIRHPGPILELDKASALTPFNLTAMTSIDLQLTWTRGYCSLPHIRYLPILTRVSVEVIHPNEVNYSPPH